MNRKWIRSSLLLAGAVALATSASVAQPAVVNSTASASMGMSQATSGMTQASPADRMFLRKAAQGNAAEIAMARLAVKKAESPAVRKFAERLIYDHTMLGKKAGPVLQGAGVTPPSGPSLAQQQEMAALEAVSGNQFDDLFIKDAVADHIQVLAMFCHEAADGQDPQVKAFASMGTPIIHSHLVMAKRLARQMDLNTSGSVTTM